MMTWEDAVLAIGGFVLLAGLVPAITSREKPPRLMCLTYAIVLTGFGLAYYSLGAPYAAGIALAQGVGWLVLVIQKRGRHV